VTEDAKKGREQAKSLLRQIPGAKSRLRQRLLLAAAVSKLLSRKPIVVGGTAEEYWAGGEYHPTDLDLCPRPSPRDRKALEAVGLRKKGRHWTREDLPVAVEFPGSGDDIERTVVLTVSGVSILMISCEDLYLDRVRQATVSWPHEDISFDAALEIGLTNYATMDWDYVRRRLRTAISDEGAVGTLMASVNRRVRSRARRASLELSAQTRQLIRETGSRVIRQDAVAIRMLEGHDERKAWRAIRRSAAKRRLSST
jgi:hypothetical protein